MAPASRTGTIRGSRSAATRSSASSTRRLASQAGQPRAQHVQLDGPGVPAVARGERQQQRAFAGAVAHLIAVGEDPPDVVELAGGGLLPRIERRMPGGEGPAVGSRRRRYDFSRSAAVRSSPRSRHRAPLRRCWRTSVPWTPANCSAPARSPAATSASINPTAAVVLTGSAAASRRHQRTAAGWSRRAAAATCESLERRRRSRAHAAPARRPATARTRAPLPAGSRRGTGRGRAAPPARARPARPPR